MLHKKTNPILHVDFQLDSNCFDNWLIAYIFSHVTMWNTYWFEDVKYEIADIL